MANIRQIFEGGVFTSGVTASLHSNHTVGLCIEDDYGRKFVLCYNEADSISTQHGCTIASGSTTGYTITVSALSGSSPLAGVPVTTIPTAQYGFVQTSGYKTLKAASLVVSANTPLLLSSAGIFSQQSFITGIPGVSFVCGGTGGICGYILSTTTAARGSVDAFFKSLIYPS
mgnify:CR=1 FL=1